MTTLCNINETMTSNELFEMLDFKEKKALHKAIKSMFDNNEIDGAVLEPSLDSRGYVDFYILNELASKMFVATKDIHYLAKITQYWIDKPSGSKPMSKIELARENLRLTIIEEQVKQLEYKKAELEVTLDESMQWSSIKQQEMINKATYKWRDLTAWHNSNGVERKDVFDQNYGTVKSYAAEAWLAVYNIDITTNRGD